MYLVVFMPIIRKISAHEAAQWQANPTRHTRSATPAPDPSVVRTLVAGLSDRSGISRIDYKATHGWLARVYPPGQGGATITKSFSDGVYGGPDAALQAAVEWRDAERAAFPSRDEPAYRIWRINPYRGRSLAFRVRRANGEQRSFSTTTYGSEQQAWHAAERWGQGAEHSR